MSSRPSHLHPLELVVPVDSAGRPKLCNGEAGHGVYGAFPGDNTDDLGSRVAHFTLAPDRHLVDLLSLSERPKVLRAVRAALFSRFGVVGYRTHRVTTANMHRYGKVFQEAVRGLYPQAHGFIFAGELDGVLRRRAIVLESGSLVPAALAVA